MKNKNRSFWEAEVRDYEVDFQGILNNACYFHYLDNARCLFFRENGLDVIACSKEGINIVIIEAKLTFKFPMKYADIFTVESVLTQASKVKFLFDQKIYLSKNKKQILDAQNIICSVDAKTKRPFLYDGLLSCII